ncbi:MAG: carboxypeptidase-like regulatory domain-containing protein [Candidatus Omnitrophota bacterium]
MRKNKIKNQKTLPENAVYSPIIMVEKIKIIFGLLHFVSVLLLPSIGFCDVLRLREVPKDKEGNEVEILEEKADAFIIKVPKDEIEVILRKRPTEAKLWHEKRILWEETGDYITIYLPKEKIILPEDYKGDEYDAAKGLKKELTSTGAEGRPPEATFWKGTSKITGRILNGGNPLSGVKIRIVNVPSQVSALSQILGPKVESQKELVFDATTNELGWYELTNIPMGEYDIFWSLPGSESWYRKLSEKPNITVRPGETVNYPDIETK